MPPTHGQTIWNFFYSRIVKFVYFCTFPIEADCEISQESGQYISIYYVGKLAALHHFFEVFRVLVSLRTLSLVWLTIKVEITPTEYLKRIQISSAAEHPKYFKRWS